eukprot:TRINITY_DN6005_c0_g1_i1.p1 TRINITY_DN6005_c0_g1~~TRINITY_DN6005_c0_g1_i1.p1  ORF type:complete len:480 (+),score=81.48 TRINITY_DN6005_c0_g1_i1:23-1441(+)
MITAAAMLSAMALGGWAQLPRWHYTPLPHNWMNDPNGMFYDPVHEKYHLFTQYLTPRVWSHAVSDDLLSWNEQPIALLNNNSYDSGGVFSGSGTVLRNGSVVLLYSVSTNDKMCAAFPTNPNDPNMAGWTKSSMNPIVSTTTEGQNAPAGRDPTTMWFDENSNKYLFTYGTTSGAVVFSSTGDLNKWTNEGFLMNSTSGQWECPNFFETNIPDLYLLKASTKGKDYFLLGSYDPSTVKFHSLNGANMGASPSQLYDHGTYYASKSFYDPKHKRQILYGWVREERSVNSHGSPYGWASCQSFPRVINVVKIGSEFVTTFNPISEMMLLRNESTHVSYNESLAAGEKTASLLQGISFELTIKYSGSCGVLIREGKNESTKVTFDNTTLVIDTTMSSNNETGHSSSASLKPSYAAGDIRIVADRSILEVYANNGSTVMTRRMYPNEIDSTNIVLISSPSASCKANVNGWLWKESM